MSSVFVVENDLKDSVKEYGSIIDAVHQNTDFSESLKTYFSEQNDGINNQTELAAKLLEGSPASTLTKLSDKEFEPAFYLLVYLLSELEQTSFEQLLQQDSKVIKLLQESTPAQIPLLRDRRSLKPTTILSIINTFFNYLPTTSATRILLVGLILAIVKDTQIDFALIQSSIGDNLVGWLEAASAPEAEIKKLFWSFIKLDKSFTYKSLQLIKLFTAQYSVSLTELHDLINFALASLVVDVSFLVNNNVASALQANSLDELTQTFIKYTNGELVTLAPGILTEEVHAKSKILALAKFFVSNDDQGKNSFLYSDIPQSLVQNPAEFEKLLIDSIKAGVIEGKLNQVDQTFYLVRVNRFVVAGDKAKIAHEWETVKKLLAEWKESLVNINEIVKSAKAKIVDPSNAN